jgi:uncharacterized membrane protein YdjX (TVP38/TMEM64 family)
MTSELKDYPQFHAIAIAVQKSGFKTVLLLQLVPLVPFNVLNYLLSITPVSTTNYVLALWIGMMPVTLTFVYMGTSRTSQTSAIVAEGISLVLIL